MMNKPLWHDYLTLCKPKVVLLMLITSWVGMYLASQSYIQWQVIILGTVGIAAAAGSAATLNHVLDRHIDSKMTRTSSRPIAAGRITPLQAMTFTVFLAVIAGFLLLNFVNTLTTILTFASLIGYAMVYTLYLKRTTSQNIVIGGLSGAMPPVLGWTAITGSIHPFSLLLALIIFVWTPPHFWALAIHRANDYKNANIPMLPVTHGIGFTKFNLFLYTVLLLAVCCLPYIAKFTGLIYLISSCILNGMFIYHAWRLYTATPKNENLLAVKTFNFSILYLLLLFSALIIDHQFGVYL